jgi:hypothetical protein
MIVSAALLLLPAHYARAAAAAAPTAAPVRVSPDKTTFVLEGTRHRFVPWGFNYLGEFGKLAEDDWDTDAGWARVERDFREMKKLGANVVRWHLQFPTYMKGPAEPDAAQLARLKKLLALARSEGLYLDLTGLNCFRKGRIPAWYDALDEPARWDAQARFWDAVAGACAGEPAVFCYDLMNEPVIGPAKAGEHPWVLGELGGFYFVQRISHNGGNRDAKVVAEAWVKRMAGAVRARDAHALITVGDIPWATVWPGAEPVFYSPAVARHLDFVSVHLYPKTGRLKAEMDALALYDIGLPLVVEETFPLACTAEEFDRFFDAASDRADGWVSHYFGHTPAEHRRGAEPGGETVGKFLEYWAKKGEGLNGK